MSQTGKELFDIEKVCTECGREYKWTKGEQKFLYDLLAKGMIKDRNGNPQDYIDEPKRCPTCRQKKRARVAEFNRKKEEGFESEE